MITYQIKNSKAVKAVAFDNSKSTLFIKFADSPVYAYSGVSENLVEEFIKSPSMGKFFQKNILNQYPTNRLDN